MNLRFPYRQVRIPHSALALGGRLMRSRPQVDLTAIGPAGTIVREAILDTGSDDTVLRDVDAARLGIDLSKAPTATMAGIGSPPYVVRYAAVTLRLTDGVESCEWRSVVGFTALPLRRILLGFAGCLQFFTATFHGDIEAAELVANPLYPGTPGP